MKKVDILDKINRNEGLTVEEIIEYRKLVPQQTHLYGKYGSLALQYLEEHCTAKYWALAGDLPAYLHNIDEQADEMYDVMFEQLSMQEKYNHTDDYLADVQRLNQMRQVIEETILSEIVYVD